MKKIYIAIGISAVFLTLIVFTITLMSQQGNTDTTKTDTGLTTRITPTIQSENGRSDQEDLPAQQFNDRPTSSFEDYPTDTPESNLRDFEPNELTQEDIDEIMEAAIARGEDPEEVRYYLEQQVGHYEEEFDKDDPLEMVELIDFSEDRKGMLNPMPEHLYQQDIDGYKKSPNKTLKSKILQGTLIIQETDTENQIQTIPITYGTKEANHAWLTENLLVLFEKDSSDTEIDRVYMIEQDTGNRTYLVGSFPVYSRFNLRTDPEIYDDGSVIVVTDNENALWKIEIEYE
jgi:hypothetical protein